MTDEQAGLRSGGKFARHLFARRPDRGSDRRWVVTISRADLADSMIRGFEPLWQFGLLEDWDRAHPIGENAIRSKWECILSQPGGPEAFPAEQVMQLRWYKEEDCPLKGVRFPQLKGHKVKEWPCPEGDCRRKFYEIDGDGGPPHLAKHLRIIHDWPVQAIIQFGHKMGLNFDKLYKGMEHSFEVNLDEAIGPEVAEPAETPPPVITKCPEPDCDWAPKNGTKNAANAVRMHAAKAHPPFVAEKAALPQ